METIFCPVCKRALSWADELYLHENSARVAGCSLCLRKTEAEMYVSEWQNSFAGG